MSERVDRSVTTVEDYLVSYIVENDISDPSPWVSAETVERIREAHGHFGSPKLKPIFEFLSGEVSNCEIKVALACLNNAS